MAVDGDCDEEMTGGSGRANLESGAGSKVDDMSFDLGLAGLEGDGVESAGFGGEARGDEGVTLAAFFAPTNSLPRLFCAMERVNFCRYAITGKHENKSNSTKRLETRDWSLCFDSRQMQRRKKVHHSHGGVNGGDGAAGPPGTVNYGRIGAVEGKDDGHGVDHDSYNKTKKIKAAISASFGPKRLPFLSYESRDCARGAAGLTLVIALLCMAVPLLAPGVSSGVDTIDLVLEPLTKNWMDQVDTVSHGGNVVDSGLVRHAPNTAPSVASTWQTLAALSISSSLPWLPAPELDDSGLFWDVGFDNLTEIVRQPPPSLPITQVSTLFPGHPERLAVMDAELLPRRPDGSLGIDSTVDAYHAALVYAFTTRQMDDPVVVELVELVEGITEWAVPSGGFPPRAGGKSASVLGTTGALDILELLIVREAILEEDPEVDPIVEIRGGYREMYDGALRFIASTKSPLIPGFVDKPWNNEDPSLIVTHAAVRAIARSPLLSLRTTALAGVEEFVDVCQAMDGGFIDRPVLTESHWNFATGRASSTFQALSTYHWLVRGLSREWDGSAWTTPAHGVAAHSLSLPTRLSILSAGTVRGEAMLFSREVIGSGKGVSESLTAISAELHPDTSSTLTLIRLLADFPFVITNTPKADPSTLVTVLGVGLLIAFCVPIVLMSPQIPFEVISIRGWATLFAMGLLAMIQAAVRSENEGLALTGTMIGVILGIGEGLRSLIVGLPLVGRVKDQQSRWIGRGSFVLIGGLLWYLLTTAMFIVSPNVFMHTKVYYVLSMWVVASSFVLTFALTLSLPMELAATIPDAIWPLWCFQMVLLVVSLSTRVDIERVAMIMGIRGLDTFIFVLYPVITLIGAWIGAYLGTQGFELALAQAEARSLKHHKHNLAHTALHQH